MRLCCNSLLLFLALCSVSASTPDTNSQSPDSSSSSTSDETEIIASKIIYGHSEDDDDDDETGKTFHQSLAFFYSGEDFAIGAFRYAEENQMYSVTEIVSIAQDLLELTPESYVPPRDVTHCGDGKRKCTAGKLWKRSEEMRRADMHDAAGADLLRALVKKGIETDFVTRCEAALEWAFDNIRRQREREKREKELEEKLERRRKEEEEAVEEAKERKRLSEIEWENFGASIISSLASNESTETTETTINPDGTTSNPTSPNTELITNILRQYVQTGPIGGNYSETISLTRKLPRNDKTIEILLIEARCHDKLGHHQLALSAAGHLLQKAASHGQWIDGTPRMMAAKVGADAAMQLGLSKNALSFYQTVLKYDPEQETARMQYRGLRKVVKLIDKAEEQIQKGYNRVASEIVDECLSAMRGLDVDSPLFRSKIQLKQCTILSSMGKHEEALEHCDTAVEVRTANDSIVSSSDRKEAHLVRAEALLLDLDYDEAVQDFRAAFNLVPDDDDDEADENTAEEKRELHYKLQETIEQQEAWNGGKMDYHYNENTGYPQGRPPERDHNKILQLPIDLEERGKEIKCAWLKKQHKILVRKYHPDKYKGNKKRAARKFKEVTDSKGYLAKVWDC